MFEITNTPMEYPWGSTELLAEFRGTASSGNPEAELWFGDHPSSPSVRVDDGRTLLQWEQESGHSAFPFLVKILAVATPLSLQVHPTKTIARKGFAREERARIPRGSSERNFGDQNHKPELIIALTEFRAYVGFSPRAVSQPIIERLEELRVAGIEALTQFPRDRQWPFDAVAGVAHLGELSASLAKGIPGLGDESNVDRAIVRAIGIARQFPGDPSAALTLMLNYCVVQPGEALFVPAGTIHAYLSGLGLEIMATSDNVLRAGLTNKHVDVAALLEACDVRPTESPVVPTTVSDGARRYRPPVSEFQCDVFDVSERTTTNLRGPAIAVVIDGSITLQGRSPLTVRRGAAVVIERGDRISAVEGSGSIAVISAPRRFSLTRR